MPQLRVVLVKEPANFVQADLRQVHKKNVEILWL